MPRLSHQAQLDKSVQVSEDMIRGKLPELTQVTLDAALAPKEAEVQCPKCRHSFTLKVSKGDATTALKLLERIAGRPTEKKDTGPSGQLETMLSKLAAATGEKTPAEQAAEAKAAAEKRAALARILKSAQSSPTA